MACKEREVQIMSMEVFLLLLGLFAVLTSLVTEGVKTKFLVDIDSVYYNLVALVVSIVIGVVGTLVYYVLNYITIDFRLVIFAILMGLASGLVSMTSYDRVHDVLKML